MNKRRRYAAKRRRLANKRTLDYHNKWRGQGYTEVEILFDFKDGNPWKL